MSDGLADESAAQGRFIGDEAVGRISLSMPHDGVMNIQAVVAGRMHGRADDHNIAFLAFFDDDGILNFFAVYFVPSVAFRCSRFISARKTLDSALTGFQRRIIFLRYGICLFCSLSNRFWVYHGRSTKRRGSDD